MSTAPTPEQLGGLLRVSGSRPVASYDMSPFARGAQEIAEAGTRLGQSVADVGQASARLGRVQQLAEATNANALIHARIIGIRQRYRDDPDYTTLTQRWDDEAGKIVEDGLSGISNAALRRRVFDDVRGPLTREYASIQDQAFRGAADAHAANRQAYLQNLVAHSTLDPNDAVLAGAIDAYHALIDNAVDRGFQTREGAAAEKHNAALALCTGEYAGLARSDPQRAISQLEGSEEGHPLLDHLPQERKDALLAQARANQDADSLDVADAARLGALQAQRASDAAETAILNDRLSDNPTVTAKVIANNAALAPEARERMLGVVARAGEPDPSEEASAATALGLLDRIRRRDGDPDKIAAIGPLIEAYNTGDLRRTDFDYVAKQLADVQTPEGEALARKRQAFVTSDEPQAGASSDESSVPDEDGSQNDLTVKLHRYDLERELDQKIEAYRKAGKDPNDLFDPTDIAGPRAGPGSAQATKIAETPEVLTDAPSEAWIPGAQYASYSPRRGTGGGLSWRELSPLEGVRVVLYRTAHQTLRELDPTNPQLPSLNTETWVPRNEDIRQLNEEIRRIKRERGLSELQPHHNYPLEFESRFRACGIEPDDYVTFMDRRLHRLKPDGLHTGPDNWNGQWRPFIEGRPKLSSEQAMQQLHKMLKQIPWLEP